MESFIISLIWGVLWIQFFLQACLAFAMGALNVVGFVRGEVSRVDTAKLIAFHVAVILCCAGLLYGGKMLAEYLLFGYGVLFWIFSAMSALYLLPQIPRKLKWAWRCSTVPGVIERREEA